MSVQIGSCRADDGDFVERRDWNRFLDELNLLNLRRQGEANLISSIPGAPSLTLFATDHSGHIGAKGSLQREIVEGRRTTLTFDTDIDGSLLTSFFEQLRVLGK